MLLGSGGCRTIPVAPEAFQLVDSPLSPPPVVVVNTLPAFFSLYTHGQSGRLDALPTPVTRGQGPGAAGHVSTA